MTELISETTEGAATAVTRTPEAAKRKAGSGARKPRVAASKAKATRKAIKGKKAPNAAPKAKGARAPKAKSARQGSKTERILALLNQPGGATLKEIMKATAWQAHSVRGFIATLGKKVRIECFKKEQGTRRYKTL